ncbi:MAG: hypothetical protein JW931_00365 [Methanomicrobiaceae archaeon]|nr:hypothetical protein [Methanomicrobiaceae archaeon]
MAKKPKKETGCTFIGIGFSSIKRDELIRNIAIIAVLSLITKFIVLNVTTGLFHSFIDLFDISYYLQYAANIASGMMPYVDFNIEYPVLFLIPVLMPLPFALMTGDAMTYVYGYQVIMSLLDMVTAILVYFIALKIHENKSALFAGLMYATAFSAGYFVMTKYDSFPVFLLMATLFFTVYSMPVRGYISNVLAFFAKIFPALALPFILIFNSRKTSLKEEIISFLKVAIPVGIILFIPLFILKPDTIKTYLFATGYSVDVYVNTATYTIYSVLSATGLPLTAGSISLVMYALMVIVVLLILAFSYVKGISTERRLLTLILLTIFATVFFTKFHSPQYITWMTPFFALLLADSFKGVIMYYLVQALVYMEFPLLFNSFYTNLEYTSAPGTGGYTFIVAFFAVEYIVMLAAIWMVMKSEGKLIDDIRNALSAITGKTKGQ